MNKPNIFGFSLAYRSVGFAAPALLACYRRDARIRPHRISPFVMREDDCSSVHRIANAIVDDIILCPHSTRSCPAVSPQGDSNKFGFSLAYSYFGLRPKVLTLGKTKINLVFRSLIRTFELCPKVLTLGKTKINLVFRSLIRTFAGDSGNAGDLARQGLQARVPAFPDIVVK